MLPCPHALPHIGSSPAAQTQQLTNRRYNRNPSNASLTSTKTQATLPCSRVLSRAITPLCRPRTSIQCCVVASTQSVRCCRWGSTEGHQCKERRHESAPDVRHALGARVVWRLDDSRQHTPFGDGMHAQCLPAMRHNTKNHSSTTLLLVKAALAHARHKWQLLSGMFIAMHSTQVPTARSLPLRPH